MDIVTFDAETFYDQEYSLSKITTEKYVRDPRFEMIGLGVKVNNGSPMWYSGENFGRVITSLKLENKAVLCHNTVFDGSILSWHFGVKPKLWIDTLSMARPRYNITVGGSLKNLAVFFHLGVKGDEVVRAIGKRRADFTPQDLATYGQYCLNDVELTWGLYQRLKREIPASELLLIDRTIRMFTEPELELDKALLEDHLKQVLAKKQGLVGELGFAGTEEEAKLMLRSNDKFADYLTLLGVDAPRKMSKTTQKETWAFSKTDRSFLALLEHDDPLVVATVAARLGIKSSIEESRTKMMLDVVGRGSLPIMLKYYAAHTGRFGGGDKMNAQNLPRGGTLRKAIRAPKGKLLVACDSSQIEARMVAWLAGQKDLLEAFRQGRDVYSEFATYVYGKTITKKDKVERFCGKTSILGLGYGMGAPKFIHTMAIGQGGISLKIEAEEGARIVKAYRGLYFKIPALWRRGQRMLQSMVNGVSEEFACGVMFSPEGIELPNGLVMQYHGLRQTPEGFEYVNDARMYREMVKARVLGEELPANKWTKLFGGKVVENIVQALARIVVTEQLLAISKRYKVVLLSLIHI
jgi:DNA polymerase I-like protein with 3'-5' exonuclease and polymerase domains